MFYLSDMPDFDNDNQTDIEIESENNVLDHYQHCPQSLMIAIKLSLLAGL